MQIPSLIASILIKALDLWTTPVFRFGIRGGMPYAELLPKDSAHETIDARLAKIEVARRNLEEALGAIDELKSAAEANRAELAVALERLRDAHIQRATAEKEVQAVQSIAQADVEVFRKLAGVPSKSEIAKERLIGFILGVLASVIATAVWWALAKYWPALR
jgi:uncharacterized protein involved in exopolysaccharide biosynthesis